MTLHGNRIVLTLDELAIYHQGWWDSYHIETDALELLDRHGVTTAAVMQDPAGRTICGITPPSMEGPL
jgi:hypothetical protein